MMKDTEMIIATILILPDIQLRIPLKYWSSKPHPAIEPFPTQSSLFRLWL